MTTEEPHDNRKPGGYTDTARDLSKLAGRRISRQGVWQWWHRRAKTGFPEGQLTVRTLGRLPHRFFDPEEVAVWWRDHGQHLPYSRKVFTPDAEGGIVDLSEGKEPGTGKEA